jgi:glutamate-1-semialdehyde 2,1-aminomutase
MRAFCEGELTKDVMEIERELGVVRIGNRSEHGMSGLWPHFRPPHEEADWTNALLDRPTIMNSMTVRINTQYTKVIFTKRSPNWSLETSDFLLDLWKNQLKQVYSTVAHDDFLSESLEYNKDIATSIQNHVNNLQTRMDLQLNILYSFVAQRDNRLNTRIAKSSGRDSVSMKILAFISAIFLPPTYIAVSISLPTRLFKPSLMALQTLFSMQGLFNWEPGTTDSGGEVDVVNDKFWIYWAISAPLTVITITGWAIWWRIEMNRYPKDPSDEAVPPAGFAAQIMETLGWTPSDVNPPPTEKNRIDNWVFGGRRRRSKLGVDGNPEVDPADLLMEAEAGAAQSPVTSPKSPLRTSNQLFP